MSPEQIAVVRGIILRSVRSFSAGLTAETLRITLGASGFDLPIEEVRDHLIYLEATGYVAARENKLMSGLKSYVLTGSGHIEVERAL